MKVVICDYNTEIELTENVIQILSIENTDAFAKIVCNCWNHESENDKQIIFSDKGEPLNFNKNIEVIVNPFAVTCNDRKINNKVTQEVSGFLQDDYLDMLSDVNSRLVTIFDAVELQLPYEITYSLFPDINSLIKAYNFSIEEEDVSLPGKLCQYIKVVHRVLNKHVFIIVNLRSFISKKELQQFYEMMFYEKVYLIILEGVFLGKHENERCTIIDKDLCLIEP